jgi:hypothetical protein
MLLGNGFLLRAAGSAFLRHRLCVFGRTLTFGSQGGQAGSLPGRRSSFGRRSEGIDAPPPPPADDSAIQNSDGLLRVELPLQLRPLSRVPLLLYAAAEPGGAQKVATVFGRLWL